MITLIKLTESDKRLIIAFLLIFILVFVIIGLIGYLIVRIMRWQGRRLDNNVSDVVYTRVITDKKKFGKYARKKNWIMFYKAARIPMIILLCSFVLLLIRDLCYHDFAYNPFDKDVGFGSVLFLWDFSKVFTFSTGSMSINAPTVINSPHLVAEAWCGYIFVPFFLVGALWYLWSVQSLIARSLRIRKLSDSIFNKNLDNFNQNEQMMNSLNSQQNPNNSPQNPNQNK